ncbi:MAG: dihydrodipicolinate synthase family protein, partial [Propionibacteriales bacterium]|nr:dihydrodipicolinate synthase family protein [Propionibacteriales bacterium]
GHELMCDGMIMLGADGLVPGLANVDPAGYVRLWDAATAGDWPSAVTEQERLADLFEIVFQAPMRSLDARGVGAFKAAMVELGTLPTGTMAHPVRAIDGPSLDAIRRIVGATRSATGSRATTGPNASADRRMSATG